MDWWHGFKYNNGLYLVEDWKMNIQKLGHKYKNDLKYIKSNNKSNCKICYYIAITVTKK